MCVCFKMKNGTLAQTNLILLQTSTKSTKHAEKSLNNAAVDKAGSCVGAIGLVL